MKKTTIAKIAITSETDVALIQVLEKVNMGNAGGRVTKTDLASWMILHVSNSLSDSQIEEIRTRHFNQVAYLENLVRHLKASKRTSLTSEEISLFNSTAKRKSKKANPNSSSENSNE